MSVYNHVEPPNAAMPQANPVRSVWLGDNHMLLSLRIQVPVFGQIGNACESTALFIDRRALLQRARQPDPRSPDGFDGVKRSRKSRLHIGGAAAVQPVARDFSAERVPRPSLAHRHDIQMPVEMNARTVAFVPVHARQQIDSRMICRVVRMLLRHNPLHVIPGVPVVPLADFREIGVALARWIDGWNACDLLQEASHFRRQQPGLLHHSVNRSQNRIITRTPH